MNSGVYKIENVFSNKVYIGSTNNISNRWSQHVSMLKAGKHRNPDLQKDWNNLEHIYFEFSVLEIVENENELKTVEAKYIRSYSDRNLYNKVPMYEGLENYVSGSTGRQQRRQKRLDEAAQAAGFESWSAYKTAVLNGRAKILPK